jgi:hypothetical protein
MTHDLNCLQRHMTSSPAAPVVSTPRGSHFAGAFFLRGLWTHSFTPCSRILLEKLIFAQPWIKFVPFIETDCPIPCPQKQATVPYTGDVKVNVTPLCLIMHYAMKTYGGMEILLHAFLTLVPDWFGRSVSLPHLLLYFRGKSPGTHWVGGWGGGGSAGLVIVKKKISCPCRNGSQIPWSSSRS